MYKATNHINTEPTVELRDLVMYRVPAPVTKDEMTAYINIAMEYNYNKVDTFKGLSLVV